MHGLKIHHAWVDVFPIEHGGFSSQSCCFFSGIYVFFPNKSTWGPENQSIPDRQDLKGWRWNSQRLGLSDRQQKDPTTNFETSHLEDSQQLCFFGQNQWFDFSAFPSNYECGPQQQNKIERQIQILKLRNVDIMNWGASPIKTLQEYPNAKHPQTNPNTLDFWSLSCKAQTKMVNIFSV